MAVSPAYIDVTAQIPHVRVEMEQQRALSDIQHQVGHYEAGGIIPATWTQEQEIAHLVALAIFHQHRDFGGGVLGRTLEYTFACFPSGRIYRVNHETLITWSHRNGNRVGMSTLFVLGVGQEPTAEMLATARQHFDYTVSRTDTRVIKQRTWGHGETQQIYGGGPDWANDTDCPGRMLPWIKTYRTEEPMPQPLPGGNTEFFEETGHNLSNAFRDFWHTNGGLNEFGFPISEEEAGTGFPFSALPELAGYTCQLFERELLTYKDGEGVGRGRAGALAVALGADGHHTAACDTPTVQQ